MCCGGVGRDAVAASVAAVRALQHPDPVRAHLLGAARREAHGAVLPGVWRAALTTEGDETVNATTGLNTRELIHRAQDEIREVLDWIDNDIVAGDAAIQVHADRLENAMRDLDAAFERLEALAGVLGEKRP